MAVTQQQQPFTEAFNAWFASVADLHDVMTFERSANGDAVEIWFLIGGGALHGHAHPVGISIAAIKDGECWDFLFDEDLTATRDAGGWFCSLCPEDDRPSLPTIDALWKAHLFDRLQAWVGEKLRPATVLEFHRADGATWAHLTTEHSNTATETVTLRI